MDATSPLFLSSGHTLVYRGDACREIHYITEAEWSDFPDPRTGGTRLNILDTEPSRCVLPNCSPAERARLVASRHGVCNDPKDILF